MSQVRFRMRSLGFERKDWKIWSPKRNPIPAQPTTMWRISLCTVCMGRTNDLRQTLIKNIQDNEDYPSVEFVILNYNSSDDMHQFMLSKAINPYYKDGRLKYLITREPKFYHASHSRNIVFRNSSGAIVMNVDADNFTGMGFASYVNLLANIQPRHAVFAKSKCRIHGRLGMFRDEFENLGGYDEDLHGYGWEDYSLMGRALRSGHTLMWWLGSGVDFSRRLATPKDCVAKNMENKNWKEAEEINMRITLEKIQKEKLITNLGRTWGIVNDLEIFS